VSSTGWYVLLILAVGVERLVELRVSAVNLKWSRERGGVERGRRHFRVMTVLHAALLVGCVLEVVLLDRPFLPWLGWPMLAVVVAAQGLRWWVIATLGHQWNVRVVVVPGLPRVTGGPFRLLHHPNYVAVVAEGIALPLVHDAWLTALLFSLANAVLLTVRVRCENAALDELLVGTSERRQPA
jgi:methyltransferase